MPGWGWIWIGLGCIYLLNGLRLRLRVGRLAVAPASAEPADSSYRLLVTGGTRVPGAALQAAQAYARAQGIEVLDIVPADLRVEAAYDLVRGVNPATYRTNRLAAGRGAGAALIVDTSVLDRATGVKAAPLAGIDLDAPLDEITYFRVLSTLKRYAPTTTDLAVVDGVAAPPVRLSRRKAFLRSALGSLSVLAYLLPAAQYALIATGLVLFPVWGGVALACFCVQPAVVTWGTRLRPPDRFVLPPLRWLLNPLYLVLTVLGSWAPQTEPDGAEALRPVYGELLAGGTEPFFEQPRTTCPLCGSDALTRQLATPDLIQHKPGHFVLDRCTACGHIFQNPRLSIEGLNFYYRDFYEGLGEASMETIFGASGRSYRGRSAMAKQIGQAPRRWIDVGAGHGHFCLVAREAWPETRFDGLDMSESIEEAERRGWVTKGVRGQLIERAPELSGRYDVVSMHHYLEHTRDPAAELAAAAVLLAPGGHLLIELPDPESRFGRLLGKYWIPWFQPQHQHLMPMDVLEQVLAGQGFEVVAHERGPAHQPIDFTIGSYLFLSRIAPPSNRPWRAPDAGRARAARKTLAVLVSPLLAVSVIADNALAPFIRHFGGSNTYRVLARFRGPERPNGAPPGDEGQELGAGAMG